MECHLCKSEIDNAKIFIDDKHTVYLCHNCDLELLYPQIGTAELDKLYSKEYYESWGLFDSSKEKSIKRMKSATFELCLDLIQRYITTGKILDIGCATGYFLECAQKRGFTPFGVEISGYSSKIAKDKFGELNIFQGNVDECSFDKKFFDVIVMIDFIEHTRNLITTLQSAKYLLKENGIIFIVTPDKSSLTNKLMAGKWAHYKLEHFYYLSRKSIGVLAEKAGLKVELVESQKKFVNIDYLHQQFKAYRHFLITPILDILCSILPVKIKETIFPIRMGELVSVLRNKSWPENKNT